MFQQIFNFYDVSDADATCSATFAANAFQQDHRSRTAVNYFENNMLCFRKHSTTKTNIHEIKTKQ